MMLSFLNELDRHVLKGVDIWLSLLSSIEYYNITSKLLSYIFDKSYITHDS